MGGQRRIRYVWVIYRMYDKYIRYHSVGIRIHYSINIIMNWRISKRASVFRGLWTSRGICYIATPCKTHIREIVGVIHSYKSPNFEAILIQIKRIYNAMISNVLGSAS